MKHNVKSVIHLTSSDVLLSKGYYRRLWLAARNVRLARRDWLDELADTFRDYAGEILEPNGMPYALPLVDDAFGDDEDMRWMGYFLRADNSGRYPQSKSRKVERLQLLDLYFRIKHPHIAVHFEK